MKRGTLGVSEEADDMDSRSGRALHAQHRVLG